MSKKRKKKGAEGLMAQARAHEALYGTEWEEVSEYNMQARQIIEKYRVRPDNRRIGNEELRIFKRRLEEFRDGKRRMHGELTAYNVLRSIAEGGPAVTGDGAEAKNLRLLEAAGYVKDGKLTWKGRDLLKKMRT